MGYKQMNSWGHLSKMARLHIQEGSFTWLTVTANRSPCYGPEPGPLHPSGDWIPRWGIERSHKSAYNLVFEVPESYFQSSCSDKASPDSKRGSETLLWVGWEECKKGWEVLMAAMFGLIATPYSSLT